MPKQIGTNEFSHLRPARLAVEAQQGAFACEKNVFWLSLLYHGNKGLVFCSFWPVNAKIVRWQVVNS
jgi:hypothetical protein